MADQKPTPSRPRKYTAKYWNQQIQASLDRQQKFFDQARESIKVFNATHSLEDVQRKLNCWWYSVNMLLPAYYSSTPKCETRLRKRAGSQIIELGSVVLERNVQYSMDEDFDFDIVGYNAAQQFLLTGRAVLWGRYEPSFKEEETQFNLLKGKKAGSYTDSEGKPYKVGKNDKLHEDETGISLSKTIQVKDDEKAILDTLHYDDYVTSDGRNESEIEWRGRRAFLSEEEIAEMFGQDVADSMSYDCYPESIRRDAIKNRDMYDGKAELWEIHCEESGKIYWIQRKGDKSILEQGDPEIQYEGFYPCSVINSTTDPDSTIPVSDYTHCRDQIIEVERLTTRIHAITQAIRTNTLYDATMGAQVEQIMMGDLKVIPVTNWPSYKSRGGLAASMEAQKIDQYIQALQILTDARRTAQDQLNESLKISDLLRGASEPTKTATANRLENSWSSLGLIVRQNQFAEFIGKGVSKLGSIIAQQFSDERILDVADADELLMPLMPTPDPQNPQDPQMVLMGMRQSLLQAIRDNSERQYRIEIATDSMVALDEKQERSDGVDLMQSAGSFFQQMTGLIEQYPLLAPFSMELFRQVVRRYKGGGEVDGLFEKALSDIGQLAQQKQAQASQTPTDPHMLETQTRMQIAQQEAQSKEQIAMIQSQDAHQKNMVALQESQAKVQQAQIESQIKQGQTALEQWKAQQDIALRQEDLKIKANLVEVDLLKVQATTQVQMAEIEIEKENQRLAAIIDGHKLQLDHLNLKLNVVKEAKNGVNAEHFVPPPVDNLHKPILKRKEHTLLRDSNGNISGVTTIEHLASPKA